MIDNPFCATFAIVLAARLAVDYLRGQRGCTFRTKIELWQDLTQPAVTFIAFTAPYFELGARGITIPLCFVESIAAMLA
jgi:hypothetical protein